MKILYGVCGIGNGHINRQRPIIDQLLKEGHQILIFAYDLSFQYFEKLTHHWSNLQVKQVAVPYFIGFNQGLDFNQSLHHPANNKDFFQINSQAMDYAQKTIGRPDLVISDYEPICAQYGYSYQSPVITIDQQTKFLFGNFPESFNGHTFKDEQHRLHMFFPLTKHRFISSFFQVELTTLSNQDSVTLIPPLLKRNILDLPNVPTSNEVLVYLSPQILRTKELSQINQLLTLWKNFKFNVFVPNQYNVHHEKNVCYYPHNHSSFEQTLNRCCAIISTAGHGLLSEAMYLEKPTLAIALDLYEQQMNAHIIDKHQFGLMSTPKSFGNDHINQFLSNIEYYQENIKNDKKILLRSANIKEIVNQLNAFAQI